MPISELRYRFRWALSGELEIDPDYVLSNKLFLDSLAPNDPSNLRYIPSPNITLEVLFGLLISDFLLL